MARAGAGDRSSRSSSGLECSGPATGRSAGPDPTSNAPSLRGAVSQILGERVFVPHAPESFRRRYRARRLSRALHHRTVPRCAGGEKRLLRGRIGESNRLGFCLLTYRLIHRARQRPGGRQEQSHHMVKLPLRVDRNASGAGRLSAHVVALTSKPPTSGLFCQIA